MKINMNKFLFVVMYVFAYLNYVQRLGHQNMSNVSDLILLLASALSC